MREKQNVQLVSAKKEFLNTTQAAAYLGIHPETLRRSRYCGSLFGRPPPKHIRMSNRNVRYDIEDLNSYMSDLPKGIQSVETMNK